MNHESVNNVFFKGTIWFSLIALILAIAVFSSVYPKQLLLLTVLFTVFSTTFILLLNKPDQMMKTLTCMLLVSIFLIPEVSFGGLGLRLDDGIVIPLMLFLLITLFSRKLKLFWTPINKWIFLFVFYSIAVTSINIVWNNLSPLYLLFSIRELQYFIYFFAFVYVMKNEWFRNNFIKLLLVLSLMTMAWGCYQLLFDSTSGYYGVGIISETASSQSGGAYFLISMFFLYLVNSKSSIKKSVLYFILFMISGGLVLATMSRTAILAFVVTYLIYLGFTLFKMSVKRILIWVYFIALAAPFIYWILSDYLAAIFERLGRIDEGKNFRSEKWDYLLSFGSDLGVVFGEGRGFVQTITGGMTLAADSQYVRNIIELGYIGSVLFLFVIISIVIFAIRHLKTSYGESLFLILSTCGFLMMSVTHEVFLVTIQASLYWILVGSFVGMIVHKQGTLKEEQ